VVAEEKKVRGNVNELISRPGVEYGPLLSLSSQIAQAMDTNLVPFLKQSGHKKQWIRGFSKHLSSSETRWS